MSKRWMIVPLAVLSVLLAACQQKAEVYIEPDSNPYPAGVTAVSGVWINPNERTLEIGMHYQVEKKIHQLWQPVATDDLLIDDVVHVTQSSGYREMFHVGFKGEGLSSGSYRIVKHLDSMGPIYCYFTVK